PQRSSNDTTTNDGPQAPEAFVITKEYRRFAEFCDACRRYRYIGLCYGSPGVGKTLFARHYADWDRIEAHTPVRDADTAALVVLLDSHTVFYTPAVVNSPGQIEHAILPVDFSLPSAQQNFLIGHLSPQIELVNSYCRMRRSVVGMGLNRLPRRFDHYCVFLSPKESFIPVWNSLFRASDVGLTRLCHSRFLNL